jgi:plasmid stabilization system protein ParE
MRKWTLLSVPAPREALPLSQDAQNDLDDIRQYLTDEGGAALARYVLRELRTAMGFLGATPGASHVREDLTDEPVKFWTVFSYMIVYDPVARPIGVARVLYGSMDLEKLFRKHSSGA